MAFKKHPRFSDKCSGGMKRKHITITVQQKVEILWKLEKGFSVCIQQDCFGFGTATVYNIKKQLKTLLKFYVENDVNKGIAKHKTMHVAKSADLYKLEYKQFKQCHSEGVPTSGPILIERANNFIKVRSRK